MDLVERLTRKHARHTTVDGRDALVTNADPDLVAAFDALGWKDPHVDDLWPTPEETGPKEPEPEPEEEFEEDEDETPDAVKPKRSHRRK